MFIPLYINGSFYFPFIFPKIWLFQLVTEIIFFFYIILAVLEPRFRPKRNFVVASLGALTLILIITSFIGVDVFRSFWGNTERMSGVIAWLHFTAFFLILSGVLKTEKEWKNFFGLAVIASILQFFYVLIQYLIGPDAGTIKYGIWLPGSQVGTVGNADLLGLYAVFSAFFALYLWSRSARSREAGQSSQNIEISKYWWFWAAGFFINILTLYFAGSRGAMLGFGAGIFFYILMSAWRRPEIRKKLAFTIAVFFLLYGIIWTFRDSDFIMRNYQLSRITHLSLKDTTIQQRFTEWGIAWDAFKAKPIFGFGQNNYLYLHNAFLNPRVYNLQETNFDRAHNAYLDYASMSGILGLLGYLFFIAILFWVFWKADLIIWASLAIAYAVNSFFVFDSPASYIVLFLTVGFASYIANQEARTKNQEPIRDSSSMLHASRTNPQTIAVISIAAFIAMFLVIWQVSWKPAAANLNFTSAFTDLGSDKISPEAAFEKYKKALKYETLGTSEFRNQYTQWFQQNINKFPLEKRLEVITFGIDQLEQEVGDHPLVFAYLNLGQMYYFLGNGTNDETIRQASYERSALAYEKGLELAPKRLEILYSHLQLAITKKDYSKAVEIGKKLTEVAPNYAPNWWYQGVAYLVAGQNEQAIKSVNRALLIWLSPDVAEKDGFIDYDIEKISKSVGRFASKQEILGIVNPYIQAKRWKELLLLYLGVLAFDPNDLAVRQSLALVYQNLGRPDKVTEELKVIENLQQK